MVWKYPPEVEALVREWAPKLRDQELALFVNDKLGTHFTAKSIKAYRGNHHIRNYQPKSLSHEEYWKYQTKYPQGMYEYIRDNSWNVSSKEMAERVKELFGYEMTPTCMKQFRQRHHIKSGLTGWYQKGHAPGNKGKKLEEYVGEERAAEIKKRISATQFKKGERPMNELPVGTIVVNSYGYKLRKKQMTGTQWERWEFLHLATWIEHNGPIPKGMVVTFKDGNKLNCDISNLMLISKGQSAVMTRKGYRSEDPDITEAGATLAALELEVKKKKKARKKRKKGGEGA